MDKFVPYQELQYKIGSVDLNVIPLQKHEFNNCKSELKYFEASIVDKVIGGVFGEEEYYAQTGEVKVARKLFWWRSVDSIADVSIPNKREVEKVDSNGFIEIPEGIEDELPFD